MLYFIHGDPNMIFEKASSMANSLLKKKPDASIFKINSDNFSEDKMQELLGGQGLFSNKYVVTLSRLLEKDETLEYMMSVLKELKESDNIFIWTEEDVKKKELNKIEKVAEKVQNFEVKKKTTEERMNIFDLAGAIGERDKKRVWVLYQKAISQYSAEEIYGTIWWQIKTMLIASKTNSPEEAGMKAYPYNKAKGYLRKYSEEEVKGLAFDLVKGYHQVRLDSELLSLYIEKFLLRI